KKIDADNVEHWIKRVEQASEYAVSEAFSLKKTSYSRRPHGPVLDLETTDQLLDHDEAYVEAQELLSDWMNSKLKLELMSDQEGDAGSPIFSVPPQESSVAFQKYEKFDDLYEYLEEELEDTTVQDFLQHLLQSEVVSSGILEDIRNEDLKEKKKTRDPRITMDLRHKQVKENRLRRQKELELLKQEKALKKMAMSEAQKQFQAEKKNKALKAKREEEAIQKQMVKLRKELVDRRQLMEEARKMERKRHRLKRTQRLVEFGLLPGVPGYIDFEKEQQKKEKHIKIQELLKKVDCLQKYFSAWYKLILDLRLKMGKARALADWKCQLKTLRAWRDYVWSQKLRQETQKMEDQLRDQNRKKQLATEFNRKCILRHYFAEWQCWSQAEVEKRELHLKKEETRMKMAKLLEEVTLGKLANSWEAKRHHETEKNEDQSVSHTEVTEIPLLQGDPTTKKVEKTNSYSLETSQKLDLHSPLKPKWAWQVTLKHAAFNTQDCAMFGNQTRSCLQYLEQSRSEKPQPAVQSRRNLKLVSTTHPILRVLRNTRIQMQAEEEERQRREAAEKVAQLEKRREERKLQKIKELEKQRRLEREQQLLSKAKDHYNNVLLKKRGLEPWKKLVEQTRENVLVAQKHHCFRLQRTYLLAWLHLMQEILAEKTVKAEKLYSSLLLRRYFRIWMKYKDYLSSLEEDARKHHESSLTKKVFWAWFDVFSEEKSALWGKQKIADQHSDRRIMLTVFRAWMQFPSLMKKERKKEERLEQLRRRVAEILPDFKT
ncbi:hypothetical protein JD844_033057, partial [Phrynosoma platyrhinos]